MRALVLEYKQQGILVHWMTGVTQWLLRDEFVIRLSICYETVISSFAPLITLQKSARTCKVAYLRPPSLMLPTRAASAFHAAVHDLRVARLVRLANKNVATNISIERFDYAGLMRAVEITRAELLLSGEGVSFQANTAALKPMMPPLPTPSRQPFAQM